MFAESIITKETVYYRSPKMDIASPTNAQAEILYKDYIPSKYLYFIDNSPSRDCEDSFPNYHFDDLPF